MENQNVLKFMSTKPMRLVYWTFMVCITGILGYGCTGCMTVNPQRFEKEYKSWVPVGTSAADAERIMKKHGFKCERTEYPSGYPWAGPILRLHA